MRSLLAWIPRRLLPALVTAAGVALIVGGLLTYQDPPGAAAVAPPQPPAVVTPSASPGLLPLPSLGPSAPDEPTSSPVLTRVATRVVVPALQIDLPVVKPPADPDHFPYCDVAEYIPQLSRPGYPGTTYLYAHARAGMFLPLLETPDARMPGMLVQVYTNDAQVFLYEITEVLRGQTSLDRAFAATEEQLMLQTSEGPRGTVGKTMVVARPISVGPADPETSNPVAKPAVCE